MSQQSSEEREYKKKVMKYGLLVIGPILFLTELACTYLVASECGYNPALGQGFTVFGIPIYNPFAFYFWCNDAEIASAIPLILQPYRKWPYIALAAGGLFTYAVVKGLKQETSHGSARWAKRDEIGKMGLDDTVWKNGKQVLEGQKKLFGLIPIPGTGTPIQKKGGVVVGLNPFKPGHLMLHDGVEHMLLMAPTRSGKGVNTIIPTGVVWPFSIFFFDVKGELWQATSGYRQMCMHQKVMKYEPLQQDGSSAKWNPLAEVNFQTPEESGDIESIVSIMVKPDGEKKGGDPFWDNSASGVLKGAIMHLLYKFYQEGRRLPCPSDIMSLLSSPDKSTKDLFEEIKTYPHISPDEFLEMEYLVPGGNFAEFTESPHPIPGEPDEDASDEEKRSYQEELSVYRLWYKLTYLVNAYEVYRKGTRIPKDAGFTDKALLAQALDENGLLMGDIVKFRNCLKEVYGEYVMNLRDINAYLKVAKGYKGRPCIQLSDVRDAILACGIGPNDEEWKAPEPEKKDDGGFNSLMSGFGEEEKKEDNGPRQCLHVLLTHPKVAEAAANIVNGADQTVASILQTAQTAMVLYQNPVVQRNTEVSDFCIRDLLKPAWDETVDVGGRKIKRHFTGVSLYLCMESREVTTLKPLSRLLINSMLQTLIRSFEFDASGGASMKQRLLLMLDEFPQLGNLKQMELALAVCAGYGIKICIVSQDINQLNKEYTKDNSIGSNCHVHIYFTPNIDSGGATAESISKQLGKKTIKTVNHSDGGGLGKGSNSESFTGRELMTPDEVSHMSSEEEIVFVAGNHPIHGKKFRYYLSPKFLDRLNRYPKAYAKFHKLDGLCKEAKAQTAKAAKLVAGKKYTKESAGKLKVLLQKAGLMHPANFVDWELDTAFMEEREPNFSFLDPCLVCAASIKAPKGIPAMKCPGFPVHSDKVTCIVDFPSLFAIHAADAMATKRRIQRIRQERAWEDGSWKNTEEEISKEKMGLEGNPDVSRHSDEASPSGGTVKGGAAHADIQQEETHEAGAKEERTESDSKGSESRIPNTRSTHRGAGPSQEGARNSHSGEVMTDSEARKNGLEALFGAGGNVSQELLDEADSYASLGQPKVDTPNESNAPEQEQPEKAQFDLQASSQQEKRGISWGSGGITKQDLIRGANKSRQKGNDEESGTA